MDSVDREQRRVDEAGIGDPLERAHARVAYRGFHLGRRLVQVHLYAYIQLVSENS